jgi:hypothetical protein
LPLTHSIEYFDEINFEESFTISSIFAITPLHDIVNIYGSPDPNIVSKLNISDHISSKNNIQIRITEKSTLILNTDGFPWIGIITDKIQDKLLTNLYAIKDFIALYHKFGENPDILEVLQASEVLEFIKSVFSMELSPDYNQQAEYSVNKLKRFAIFLHPMRLTIMQIIVRYFSLPRARLEKSVGGNRGNFTSNLTKLLDQDILGSEIQFIDGKPRTVIFLNQDGLNLYNQFRETISILET